MCPRLTFWGLVVVGLVASSANGGPSGRQQSGPANPTLDAFVSPLDLSRVPAPFREGAQRGVRALAEGRFSTAVESLSELALDLPGNAAVQTVLAEALLARSSTANGSPRDLAIGLDAAEHAVALAPRSDTALFIRAEILTRLHLGAAATSAWTRYLAVDPDSLQADHARAAIETLRAPSAFDLWDRGDRDRFETAAKFGDSRTLVDLVKLYPLFARLYSEEILLPRWGRSGAAKELEALERIAAAFEAVLHDSMLGDTVRAIGQTPAGERARIAQGLVAFGEGMGRYRQNVLGDPGPWLSAAALDLDASHSPFAGWPRFYSTVLLQRSSVAAADAVLRSLQRAFDAARYPSLAGRIRWLEATGEIFLERPETSLAPYRAALDILSRSEGQQIEGYVRLLIGEAYARLGDRDQEWREYEQTLSRQSFTELRAQEATLYVIVESLLGEKRTWAALGFSRELASVCRHWGRPGALAEQALQFGRLATQLGDDQGALKTLRAALGFAAKVDLPDLRERFEATIEMAEGRALAASDPLAAIGRLSSALARHRRTDFRYHEAGLLATRAGAFRSLGRFVEAAKDLEESIDVYEGKRGATGDPRFRQTSFEEAQAAFDAMISLQVESLGDPATAFAYAERSRARLLFDQVAGHDGIRGLGRPLGAKAVEGSWPKDSILVEYAVLRDHLYIWSLASGQLRLHVEPVGARDLQRAVGLVARDVGRGEFGPAAQTASRKLYERLIRPIADVLPDDVALSIVPDRFLAQLPFAALLDRTTGRFLVENHAIAIQPSASFVLTSQRHHRAQSDGGGTYLVIGDPTFDPRAYPRLRLLPNSLAEAREVSAAHPGSTLLVRKSATRSAFLRAAPGARVIHIAAHAILDPREPNRSRIVLGPDPDGTGGALAASEIAQLDLSNTDLVVLSVCSGVAGDDLGRENISGLAAAFLAAGVRTVIASPWEVDDVRGRSAMVELDRLALTGKDLQSAMQEINRESILRSSKRELPVFIVYGGELR